MTKLYPFIVALMLLGISLHTINTAVAQEKTYEEIVAEMENEFQEYAQKNEALFNAYVENNDKEFSDFLRKAWDAYQLQQGIEPPSYPKPVDPPKIDPLELEKDEPVNIPVDEPMDTVPDVDNNKVSPGIQKTEPTDFDTKSANMNFYGAKVYFEYDVDFITTSPRQINENAMADYWSDMSKTNHYHFVNQMLSYKTQLNLNDWGFYKLVDKAAGEFIADRNARNLFVWFVLSKSRYKARVGYNESNIYLLLPSVNMLYGVRYYRFNDINYYLVEGNANSIRTYKKDYPDARLIFDMHINSPLNIGSQVAQKDLKFSFEGETYQFTVKYNRNAIDFYDDYPQTNIEVFFDAAVSDEAKQSLVSYLKPIVAKKDELDAANLIIHFVQTAFSYKTDQQQFGREKFFFPEEIFHYAYSDCEDRSVLFAYLIRELLNKKAVGIAYPGHMATAVNFDNTAGMDYFTYEGEKYVVCDPTYINASVGMCMPKYVDSKAKIVKLKNIQYRKSVEDMIWDKAMAAGGNRGSNSEDIVFDKQRNAYITGYYKGTISFDDKVLSSNANSNDAFIAKLDKNQQFEWVKSAGGLGNDIGTALAIDKDNNVYITGFFDETTNFEGRELASNGVKDVFVAKYSPQGKLIWLNKMDIDKPNIKNDHIFVSRFNADGKHESTILFEETENFNSYGITLDNEGNCFVTAAFSSIAEVSFASRGDFNFTDGWDELTKKLKEEENYVSPMAGFFAFLKLLKVNGVTVTGKSLKETLDEYNPVFRKISPHIYQSIEKIDVLKNSGGIITLTTLGKNDVSFKDLTLKNNAKFKITSYKGGNALINILDGVSIGSAIYGFEVNSVKLVKNSGNMVFDFDEDHTHRVLNLKKDFLR